MFALDHRISLSRIDDGIAYRDLSYYDAYYAPLLDGTSPARYAGARMTSVEYLANGVTSLNDWSRFFTDRGWSQALFQYTSDEPSTAADFAAIPAAAAAARAATPTPVRTLVTTTIQQADQHGVRSAIDILTPLVNYMDDKSGQPYAGDQRPRYDAFLAGDASRELWMYQSCMSHDCGGSAGWATGWPSYMIDASALRNRAMQWMLYRFGATGELYWETGYALYANRDAWADQWAYTGNGDGTLFYPGTVAKIGGRDPIPIASIRLKMIREGMEDFEYMKILERCNRGAEARGVVSALFPDAYSAGGTGGSPVTPDQLMAARQQLADLIVSNGCGR